MLNGFLVVDKPAGVTSHDVVAILRRACRQKKIGHTGTLDPFATGVLPIALGEGTKAIHYLDESVKEYRAVMRLGISTDTQDLTGRVLRERDWRKLTPDSIKGVVPLFCGDIAQVPPMYSALKRDGVPLYKLARKGESVERAARPVRIHSLTIDRIELPDVYFTVRCSRGTYVRTLADDMGERLGTGAHLLELRRTASGPFTIAAALPLAELTAATPEEIAAKYLLSIRTALSHLPEITVSAAACARVLNGIAPEGGDLLGSPAELPVEGEVMLCCEGCLVALGKVIPVAERADDKVLQLARVFNQLYPLH